MMLSKDEDNAEAEGNWEKLLFVVHQHEKHRVKQNDCTGRSALSPVFSFRWKTRTCFITNTHTFGFALYLHSPTVYQTLLCFAVMSFTWFSSSFFLFLSFSLPFPFIPNENRGGTRWLNCSLFMLSSRVNVEPSGGNWILQLVAAESSHGDVACRWDTTQSRTCFLPFKPKHTSSEQARTGTGSHKKRKEKSSIWYCDFIFTAFNLLTERQWNVGDVLTPLLILLFVSGFPGFFMLWTGSNIDLG